MTFELNYAGEFLKNYRRPKISLNATINYLFTESKRFLPAATITKEVMFPDVSFYQREIDFEVMKTKGRV